MKFKGIIALIVVLALALGVMSVTGFAAKSRNTNSKAVVEFTPGELTLRLAPNIDLGEHKLTAKSTTYFAEKVDGQVFVIDARGNKAGWSVKASLSTFKDGVADVLPGSSLIMTPSKPVNNSPVTPPSYTATKIELISGDTTNKTLWTAKVGEGNGGWHLALLPENVGLFVPINPNLRPGDYTANLNWTLVDAPAN